MASKISRATGNFTAAGTWGVVNSNGLVDSEAASTAISTTELSTPSFTPGAITCDGILLKLQNRASSPSGTFTVTLRNTSSGTDLGSVTVNVSDLPSSSSGWAFFEFSSPILTIAANTHVVKVVCSDTGSQVTLYRSGTTDDFSKMLCTTTTGAPAANDQLIIVGKYTGTGASTAFTVTLDNTAATSFGGTAFVDGIAVGALATLTCGTAGSTAYRLVYKGRFSIWTGGTVNFGTSGTRIPSTSSFILDMNSTANVDTGLVVFGGATFNAYGQSVAAYQTLLTTDEGAGATVLGVASTSGWANGDEIAIASTSRTSSEHEKRTISTVDSATQVTVTSGLTNAHSGTSPTQAEVIHLTRNVKIRGQSASLQGYVVFQTTSVVVCDSVQFKWLGSGTTNKRGIDITTTTGSCTITGCSMHEFSASSSAFINVSGGTSDNISIETSVFWSNALVGLSWAATTGTANSIADCTMIGAGSHGYSMSDVAVSITDCVASSCNNVGFNLSESNVVSTAVYSNLTAHSNASSGFAFTALCGATMSTIVSWRNGGAGVSFTNANANGILITGAICFGNTTNNILSNGNDNTIQNAILNGDTTFGTTNGVSCGNAGASCIIENSTFGVASGIKTTHTNDVSLSANGRVVLRDCQMASGTPVSITTTRTSGANGVFSQKHNNTSGLHKRYTVYGNASTETTTFNTASPSESLSPLSATVKFRSSVMRCAVESGETVSISVYVRKDSSYNGAAPRLRQLSNAAIGIAADVTLDTFSVGADTWEQLSGVTAAADDDGVMEFFVDCDGTAGSIFVDDWSAS